MGQMPQIELVSKGKKKKKREKIIIFFAFFCFGE
jgi:hypothetical protein